MTKSYVTLKGRKDGLVMHLDDQCGFETLLSELKTFVTNHGMKEEAAISVNVGNRYCTDPMLDKIERVLSEHSPFVMEYVETNVMAVDECQKRLKKMQTKTYIGIVRSGQVLESEGDLLVVGDVNPNGKVVATGNIFIIGRLKGSAHAGALGEERAVIAASSMEATHLAIADELELVTEESSLYEASEHMQCAYLHPSGSIAVGALHDLRSIRPDFMTKIGGY